ncbi:hypothetical protein N7447_009514 [Penicillium robsamsonii]|uniref:uncharacterized protein n=1 Tax=Penicillium robsamsonii TaxID=1792511 RepID=UPI002548ED6D|nr:uncharacterized protein N7447_009514 [Penicillium robsamsonii]KAJ5817281.1 hypothetical protein N7447_009514 [Penicillium robsamsonii]
MTLDRTIALVTGANKGIGREVALQLAKDHGYMVLLGCRNATIAADMASDLQANGYSAEPLPLDLDSDGSISSAVERIDQTYGRLDVLVNNAGVLLDAWAPGMTKLSTREVYTKTYTTNVVGTACLTEALLPLLRKAAPTPPRVVFVSSHLGSLTEGLNRQGMFFHADLQAYMSSKAAVNRMALVYSRMLEDVGGLVNLVAPGFVQTDLTNNHPAGTTAREGAERIVELAVGKAGPTATFTDKNGPVPW